MTASYIEIESMIQNHQGVQTQMKFLIKALSTLSSPPSQLMTCSTSLRDRIACYRWSLYDFKEAIQYQNELDARTLCNCNLIKEIQEEDQGIRKQIDTAVKLAEDAVYNKIGQEQLIIYSQKINEAVNRMCRTIEQHMAKEDSLLRQYQKSCMQ